MPVTPLRPSDPACAGPHRLLGRLGQGGMGTVYLGVSPDDRAVAVKVLRDGFPDADARRRFRHELDALRRVRGPHLVEVLDADVEADTPYLVTRFVPGTRLDDLVARGGPLPPDDLHRVARGLADALAALHGAGVVHRDLTPGNVLVLDGQPHVIDLGLATAADVTALTRSGLVIGTPGYLAPEQVTGSAVSPAVDVHAWGATVALAGTGRPPYGTGRPEAVLYRIVHGEPDLAGLPEPLAGLVRAAMDPDPARRPDARSLLASLGGGRATPPVTVHLPHDLDPQDVDVTTLLDTRDLRSGGPGPLRPARVPEAPTRQLATAATGPRPTLPLAAGPLPPAWASAPPVEPPVAGGPPPYDWARDGALDPGPDEGALDPYDEAGHDYGDPSSPYSHGSGDPSDADASDDLVPRSPARDLQVALTALAGLAAVGAATLVAPVVAAVGVLLLLVLLRATGRAGERLRGRRERRGLRRRDPLVTALSSPWYLLLGLGDTLLSLPLLLAGAAVPAGLVWLASPDASGLDRPELTAATGVGAALLVGLSRRVHAPSRRLLRNALLTATPGASSRVAVGAVLAATALVLLATAEGTAAIWWPLVAQPVALP